MGIFAFGVGGNVLLTYVGLLVGDAVLMFNGLGRNGDRGSDEKLKLLMSRDSGVCGRVAFALYVVEGRGRVGRSSSDSSGACDNRSPICTVAEDAIDESLL